MRPSVASIIAETAVAFGITPEQITAPSAVPGARRNKFARPRQVAMMLSRQMVTTPGANDLRPRTAISFPTLGRIFGNRDHTTIICAMRTIPKLAEHDSELAEKVNKIRQSIASKSLNENDFRPEPRTAESAGQ